MTENLLHDLADRLANRFYGKYRGIVTEVDAATMRIRATVPAVLGEAPSGWCQPCVPYAGPGVGFFFLPEPGAGVWIEFEAGDVSYPIWAGCFWHAGDVPAEAGEKVRGIVTGAPHQLIFDDDADEVTLGDSNGGTLLLSSDGITATRGTSSLVVSDTSVSINDSALEVT